MPSIRSLGAIRTGVRSILADDANFYFGDWFAIDTFLVMQSPLGSALLQIVEPLAGAAIETRPAAPALHHAAPTQGVAYDGVTVIHASFTPQAAVTAAVSSVELVTNYIIDGTPFDGGAGKCERAVRHRDPLYRRRRPISPISRRRWRAGHRSSRRTSRMRST